MLVANIKIEQIIQTARKEGVSVSFVPAERLFKLVKGNHQGVVATVSPISFIEIETLISKIDSSEKTPLFLILDQITDARNFGAIIRTAVCTGVDAIIIPQKGGAPVNEDTVKTSSGMLFKIPICKVAHIKDAIYYLQASGITICAATEKTNTLVFDVNFNKPIALIMGSEGRGINPSVLKLVDEKAALPMHSHADSLNVSVACGAFLYEIIRQRSYQH